ncbi:nonstructural protein [Blackfly microvirus SF02]|uniref:Nonstructural protein n=1 Tax=Blackfly microvirus SF02 TaxID=2576452 RepID=A0A4P8PP66_9VIRU|nr:nonstructural protein [Blackfly microvirus SF02]
MFDRKALIFHTPFFAVTDGAAVRSFADLVNDPNSTVSRHPTDYVLYRVGVFDDASGMLHGADPVNHIIDAISLVTFNPSLPFNPTGNSHDSKEQVNG